MIYDSGSSEDEACLPTTPAQNVVIPEKRARRTSDVIDSIGESSYGSSPTLSHSSGSPRFSFDSPFYSPTATTTTTPGIFPGTPATGYSTPQRPPQPAHWNTGSMVSPDLGYSTPERSHHGMCYADGSSQKIELHDALGPRTLGGQYPFSSVVSGQMPVPKDADRYNMGHRQRGKCVIFNHERFDTGFETREGSSIDAHRIEQTFERLGFAVEICNDYEFADVMQKINELSQEDHSNSDCLCIFVLTHGLKNNVICAKDAAYNIERLWKPFTAERCVTLAGKPKLFFLQACRGDSLDEGVRMHSAKVSETDSIDSYKIPTHADFLFANSTVEGFYSWRNPVVGTWYIQSLCQMLDEYSPTVDLGRVLTMTARKVAMDFASYNDLDPGLHDLKQVPMVTSTLIRDLYFAPKDG
ncbi:caspase-1-like [Copidosoma floridanum]|uniref:caspase-1-like n=1 Tax=Copidosoma floridanum TaxID=29053 RepID=UPI0006C9C4D5|nr:caspase-1-like [Copidosoma floridanum]